MIVIIRYNYTKFIGLDEVQDTTSVLVGYSYDVDYIPSTALQTIRFMHQLYRGLQHINIILISNNTNLYNLLLFHRIEGLEESSSTQNFGFLGIYQNYFPSEI
jgi:hypothetical protein